MVLSVLLFGGSYIFNIQFRRPDELWTPESGFHYTMIFNTFIFMQVFNEINCRKIGEHGKYSNKHNSSIEFNVFSNFFNNPMFFVIVFITVFVQIVLVQYGGEAVKCTPLTLSQHALCIGIGILALVFGYLAKLIPLKYFKSFRLNEDPLQLTEEEKMEARRTSFRKSRTLSRSYRSQRDLGSPAKKY